MTYLFSAADYEHNVIERDGFDDDAYERGASAIPELGRLEDELEAKRKHGRALLEDVHACLLSPSPVLIDNVPMAIKPHADLLREMLATSDYAKWHASTQFDAVRSTLGTVELGRLLKEQLPQDEDERRRVLRDMIKRASGSVEDQLETYGALSGRTPSEHNMTDLQDVIKAGSVLKRSTKLQRIMAIAGRMRRLALTKHRARVRHGPDEIVDIEVGAELTRVLPSELATINHSLLRLDFMRRYAERELLQYRIDGTEPLGRGPIVVMIDTSGSMRDFGKEFWAKGIAIGLMAIAVEERRDFDVILFSDQNEFKRFAFGKAPTLDMIVKAIEFSYDGGTDFRTPLDAGLKTLEASKFQKGDLIMLTDGEAWLDPEWQADFKRRKAAKAARLFTVLIGFQSASLGPISDGVERIDDLSDDLSDDDAVADLVFGGL